MSEREYLVKVSARPSLFSSAPAIPASASAVEEFVKCDRSRTTHSIDFASVNWFGSLYCFTPMQRRVVAVLWQAWENGTPDVAERTILEEAESDSGNLRMLFRECAGWGTMIQRSSYHGGPVGCFRLVQP